MNEFHGYIPLILAAGKGTRMRSSTSKALQKLLGTPMLAYVLKAMSGLFSHEPFIVTGHCGDQVEAEFPAYRAIRQYQQSGTGHALQIALSELEKSGASHTLVVNGDCPLLTASEIRQLIEAGKDADISFATVKLNDPASYGRVIRENGEIKAIVEAKEYDAAIYGEPGGEINAGLYCFRIAILKNLLPDLCANNAGGELYITDLVALGLKAGYSVKGIECGNNESLLGVNSPAELVKAEELLSERINSRWLENGVMIHFPAMAKIGPDVSISAGARIYGPCLIFGKTIIAQDAEIGCNCVIKDSQIGRGAQISPFSHLEGAIIGERVLAGPYARLRPGAILEEGSHVGNFVELKKCKLGAGAKANHLSYLGDAEIGAHTNIGAGTITCNYDGAKKHVTHIGENAFIGSNAALVAPVSIGSNALVGAGSVITRDVGNNELAVARGIQKNLPRRKK